MNCKGLILLAVEFLNVSASRFADTENISSDETFFDLTCIDVIEPVAQSLYENESLKTLLSVPIEKFVANDGTYLPMFPNYKGKPCSMDGFKMIEKLGKGATSIVFKAMHSEGEYVVGKAFKRASKWGRSDFEFYRTEESILHKANHPSIPKGICTFKEDGHVVFIMEFTTEMTVEDWLDTDRFKDMGNRRLFVRQMVDVLKYLHGLDILHNDIRPGNVLLAKDGTIKLIDFGLARYAPKGMKIDLGTPIYMPFEKLQQSHFNNAADWYSFGMLLYEIFTGFHPFSHLETMDELFQAVLEADLKILSCPVTSNFVSMFLQLDSTHRWCLANYNLHEMENHPFWSLQ